MTGDFIPKRPHKKSRGGCLTCKTKKVKCDEVQPKCSFCHKRRLDCTYPAPSTKAIIRAPPTPHSSFNDSSSSGSSRDSTPGTQDTEMEMDTDESWEMIVAPQQPLILPELNPLPHLDIRLMHQWTTSTWKSMSTNDGAEEVLKVVVPRIAFEHDYLLYALLGVSALELQELSPDGEQLRRQAQIYRAKSVSGFRQALTSLVVGTPKYEAALLMSLLLVVLYSRDTVFEDGNRIVCLQWFLLYRGLKAIITIGGPDKPMGLSVSPIFQRELSPLTIEPVVPVILLSLLQDMHPSDPDYPMIPFYCKLLDALGMLYAGLKQDGVGQKTIVRVITFPSFAPAEFTKCAQENRPRALVILSYYMVFIKLITNLWWYAGVADRDIATMSGMLEPQWLPYVSMPLEALALSDPEDVKRLLLA